MIKKSEKSSYIVGVGASAGGMEAIHDLFDNMPGNTGFSFIVIQHLSPDHKSLMGELLSKHTAMQVQEAGDGMEIQSNCIYVIPNNKLITLSHGRLRLDDKLKSKVPNNAIDIFFESLAVDAGKLAVGIILSGTGTDGTKGLEVIKAHGGTTIVQDPLTANFDGMPNSAVNSGNVDLILPPEMIAEELVDFLKEAPLFKTFKALSQGEEEVLTEILERVHKTTRHDFSLYKRPTLLRRLAKRMSELNVKSIDAYAKVIAENEEERITLSREFLINVTKFFRDPEAYEVIRQEAMPSIFASKNKDELVKVWVAACSSGEEAYSIAILFLEFMEVNPAKTTGVKIFATDIDTAALEAASRGVYLAETIEKDVSAERLQKYFIREGNYYRVSVEVRKIVVFANHDVLKDPPFSKLDLITCRNMFIYISPAYQTTILKKFQFALNMDSFLMLGPSENIGLFKDSMEEINRKWKLYKCVGKSSLLTQDGLISTAYDGRDSRGFQTIQASKVKILSNNLGDIFKDTLFEDRAIAAVYVDKDFNVKHAIGAYKNFLSFPEETLNFNLLKLVPKDLSVALSVGLRKAIHQNQRVVMKNIVLHNPGAENSPSISITIKPWFAQKEFKQPFLCIILEEEILEIKNIKTVTHDSITSNDRIEELEQELFDTRENLQAVVEEMETTNEELQSSNEEMVSTNEELQSTNEELQSLNEELHTVSAEHQLKIKELLELNDDLVNYFNNSDIEQILVDQNLIIRKFSPSIKHIINLIDGDIGRSIKDINTNISNLNLVNDIQKVVVTGQSIEREIALGDNRFYLLRVNPYVKRDRSNDGVVVNFVDISESKKMSSIIEGVFNSSMSGIMANKSVRNSKGLVEDFECVVVNAAAQNLFNLDEPSLVGKRMSQTLPQFQTNYFEAFKRVAETGVPARLEYCQQNDDRWFDITAVKMLDGILITFTDISEKKKITDVIEKSYEELKDTSQQLVNSNTLLERSNFDLLQFASVASHDLKEPLRKIQAFGSMLQSKVHDKLNQGENDYLQKIILASQRMQVLIEDVLTLSKLSNNEVPYELVDLKTLIKYICDDLEISIKEKNATIKIGDLPVLSVREGQIRQLFQNLIANALKFCNKTIPVIEIELNAVRTNQAEQFNISAEDYVCLSVTDNGIGFEDIYKDKIFGIFQRLHGRGIEGTGIGLAIAKKIVENHEGFITATGKPGEGARFEILLPAQRTQSMTNYKAGEREKVFFK